MLRQKGALLDQNGDNALLASVESGNRECFAAMIEGQEHIILKKIRSHSLAYYAIELKSNLLPIIASITNKQCTLQRGKMDADETEFPPNDISKKSDIKKFKTALDLQDQYLPYNEIKAETKQIKSIFNPISENSQNDEILDDLDDQQIQQNNNYNYNRNDLNYKSNIKNNNANISNNNINNNKSKKHNRNDSSAFLPQIPLNSDSTKGSYESANTRNRYKKGQSKQSSQTKKLTKIEAISVKNKKNFTLSQDQLNNQSSLQTAFSSNDDDLLNKYDNEIEEEEEEFENEKSMKGGSNKLFITGGEEEYDFEEEDLDELEEEEDEFENELANNQGEDYEYEAEYEYEVVTTGIVAQNK